MYVLRMSGTALERYVAAMTPLTFASSVWLTKKVKPIQEKFVFQY